MINVIFVTTLAATLFGALVWGIKTLPAERWQMIAAVPMAKNGNGEWQGLNLTFYGFFSATASTFGVALMIVLLSSIGTSLLTAAAVIATMMAICVPASKVLARVIEGKRNTFTIAGAAFVASLILPPGMVLVQRGLWRWFDIRIYALPVLAAAAITYALSEAIGRMACLSFGCCYGKPLSEASPRLARMFSRFPLVFHGSTKKAAYASGLADEPLIPVQTITSLVFTLSGLAGLGFFLAGHWRLAGTVPALATWSWRALSECLRADHRGNSRISVYQWMALIAMGYLTLTLSIIPGGGLMPNLAAGLAQVTSAGVIVPLQLLWVGLFLYYGRSRVTGSVVSFHVVAERV
ncbi:MAG: hypothetical protein WBS19_08200 [Candidatus Korobacteraceae bacterium]